MVSVDALIPPRVQELWNNWELRSVTVLSLCLQIFLMLFASRRKTTKNRWFISLLGIAHSLADWIAAYGVGLLSSSPDSNSSDAIADELVAFWAPFFLLHLGGADIIISRSVDDSSWLKLLVGVVSHVLAILFIFLKSFPNKLWVPSILVFIVGIFRNGQRVRSLLLQSHENVRDSRGTAPAFDHTKLSETYSEMMKGNIPTEIFRQALPPKAKRVAALFFGRPKAGELSSFSILEYAVLVYDTFKGFITKVTFSSEHRNFSRDFFRNRTPADAFKLLEMELYFMYEALYTQSLGLQNIFGSVLRGCNTYLIIASLVIFSRAEKHEWKKFDLVLTYVLLSVALVQELISNYGSALSPKLGLRLLKYALGIVKPLLDALSDGLFQHVLNGPLFSKYVDIFAVGRRKWSQSVCQINLLILCLPYHSNLSTLDDKVASFFGVKDVLDILRLRLIVSVYPVTEHIKQIVFNELRKKSAIAENKETALKLCAQRGDWALIRSSLYNELNWSLGKLEYGESIILWHLATELCYSGSELPEGIGGEMKEKREFCKILSDYMLYLLALNPNMIVSVAGDWETVFHDTCAQVKSLFLARSVRNQRKACQEILSTYSHMPKRTPIGNQTKSVLVDSSVLAIQLQRLQGEQWKLMSEVWVELLAYAAFHCEADVHAQQPSQGGELLTFVWLLINHLGFGKQIMEEDAPTE